MLYCLHSSILSFVLLISGIFAGVMARSRYWELLAILGVVLILGIAFIHCFVSFIRRLIIFKQLKRIQFSTEQSISIHCSKISCLYKPISRFFHSIICLIIIDERGNKFYYVYPENNSPSEFGQKHIKEYYLEKRLELKCYKNTNVIKMLSM